MASSPSSLSFCIRRRCLASPHAARHRVAHHTSELPLEQRMEHWPCFRCTIVCYCAERFTPSHATHNISRLTRDSLLSTQNRHGSVHILVRVESDGACDPHAYEDSVAPRCLSYVQASLFHINAENIGFLWKVVLPNTLSRFRYNFDLVITPTPNAPTEMPKRKSKRTRGG